MSARETRNRHFLIVTQICGLLSYGECTLGQCFLRIRFHKAETESLPYFICESIYLSAYTTILCPQLRTGTCPIAKTVVSVCTTFLPKEINQGSGRRAFGLRARDSNDCQSFAAIGHDSIYSIEEHFLSWGQMSHRH